MAILNYGNQFRYNGDGYVDSKMAPVRSVDDLEHDINVLISQYTPGMKVTVIDDGEFGAVDYVLNEKYEWKRLIDLDCLTLSFDKGNYDSNPDTEYYLQLHYTNSNGELVALGETLDMSVLLEDVEARIEALENKPEAPSVEDTNTFIIDANVVTEKDGENGIFVKFDYNDGNSLYLDITSLEPKSYASGVGILIGEDNVIGIDEAWFEAWFNEKVAEINSKLVILENEVSAVKDTVTNLSQQLGLISGKVDTQGANLIEAIAQIAANKSSIENVSAVVEENKAEIVSLAEQLAMIRGVEFIREGSNIKVETNQDGSITISAVVPETDVDLSEVESRLTNVESTLDTHTTEIASIQEAIKNMSPEGEGLSGDNETIKANENGALSVMISSQEGNAIRKNNDGLYAQSIQMILGDDEINVDENN